MLQHEQNSAGAQRDWRIGLIAIIALAAAYWFLRQTMAISMPLVAGLLLALAVWPMVGAISGAMPRGLRWLGPTAGLLLVVALLIAFFAALGLAAQQAYTIVDNVGPRLQEWISSLGLPFSLPLSEKGMAALAGGQGSETGISTAMQALGLTLSTIGGIVLVLFLMLLMLTEAESWHQKFTAISDDGNDRSLRAMGRSIGSKFRTYFTTRLMVGAITAALYVAWLFAWGVDYLLLWGLLAVLLNFVPTVGSIIAGMLPVAYALVVKDPSTAAIVAAGLLVIEQFMGNFVDPKLMGRRIALSPLVVLVSLGFWTALWGIPGALLSVPLTVIIITTLAHVDALKPAALLLTDRTSLDDLSDYTGAK